MYLSLKQPLYLIINFFCKDIDFPTNNLYRITENTFIFLLMPAFKTSSQIDKHNSRQSFA
ncbi:MAG TPA: hypothetical protein DCL91_01430 [Prevotella stercorea]|nr:hypothetical protein [Leyella stercorea]